MTLRRHLCSALVIEIETKLELIRNKLKREEKQAEYN